MFLYYYKDLYNNIPYECNFYKYSCKNMFSVSLFSPLKKLEKKSASFFKMDIFKNVQNEIHGPRMLQKSEFTRGCFKSRKNDSIFDCIIFYFFKMDLFQKLRENRKKPIKFRLFKIVFL